MKPARGFTLFEFAVCAALSALLACVLLSKLLDYRAQMERASALQVVAAARTAMAVRIARMAGQGDDAWLAALAQENPVSWLEHAPANYQGEYYRPGAGLIKPGHWYYDRSDKSINFLLSNDTFTLGTSKLLKFKVELIRELHPSSIIGRSEATHKLALNQVHDGAGQKYNQH